MAFHPVNKLVKNLEKYRDLPEFAVRRKTINVTFCTTVSCQTHLLANNIHSYP